MTILLIWEMRNHEKTIECDAIEIVTISTRSMCGGKTRRAYNCVIHSVDWTVCRNFTFYFICVSYGTWSYTLDWRHHVPRWVCAHIHMCTNRPSRSHLCRFQPQIIAQKRSIAEKIKTFHFFFSLALRFLFPFSARIKIELNFFEFQN